MVVHDARARLAAHPVVGHNLPVCRLSGIADVLNQHPPILHSRWVHLDLRRRDGVGSDPPPALGQPLEDLDGGRDVEVEGRESRHRVAGQAKKHDRPIASHDGRKRARLAGFHANLAEMHRADPLQDALDEVLVAHAHAPGRYEHIRTLRNRIFDGALDDRFRVPRDAHIDRGSPHLCHRGEQHRPVGVSNLPERQRLDHRLLDLVARAHDGHTRPCIHGDVDRPDRGQHGDLGRANHGPRLEHAFSRGHIRPNLPNVLRRRRVLQYLHDAVTLHHVPSHLCVLDLNHGVCPVWQRATRADVRDRLLLQPIKLADVHTSVTLVHDRVPARPVGRAHGVSVLDRRPVRGDGVPGVNIRGEDVPVRRGQGRVDPPSGDGDARLGDDLVRVFRRDHFEGSRRRLCVLVEERHADIVRAIHGVD